jgi:hypothetical protein
MGDFSLAFSHYLAISPLRPPSAFRTSSKLIILSFAFLLSSFSYVSYFSVHWHILMRPPINPGQPRSVKSRLRGYGSVIEELCQAMDSLHCGPDLTKVLDYQRDFHEDGIHPTAQGHRKIGRALAPHVRSAAR